MARKKKRDANELITLDEYLDDQGTRGQFEAHARLEVRAWQIGNSNKTKVPLASKKNRKPIKVAPTS